jgi:uncharacterized LabA/DUF88 family protein
MAALTWGQERVAIFVDGGGHFEVRNAVFEAHGKQMDFAKFCNKLCGPRKLLRAYYCNALPSQQLEPDAYRKSLSFMDRLEYMPYVETCRAWLMYPPGGGKPVPKGVDMRVALQMVRLAYNNAYDTAILVSGDADLVEAVRCVKELGKQVEYVCYPGVMRAEALVIACDKTLEISSDWASDCIVEKKKQG